MSLNLVPPGHSLVCEVGDMCRVNKLMAHLILLLFGGDVSHPEVLRDPGVTELKANLGHVLLWGAFVEGG